MGLKRAWDPGDVSLGGNTQQQTCPCDAKGRGAARRPGIPDAQGRGRAWSTLPRPRSLPLIAAVVAAALAPLTASAATKRLESPRLSEIARATTIPDTVIGRRTPAAASTWGGVFSTAGGPVTVRVSDTYPQDPARAQRWADFLASLVHGSELSTVILFLAPLDEVQDRCGGGALACYGNGLIVAPGDDPTSNTSAEAVVTHEYGHHVASSRDNTPWPAVEYGTKRWASYENVCARTT